MRTLVLLLPWRNPGKVWRKGLNYAKQYHTELVAFVLVEQENQRPDVQELLASLLSQAEKEGISAISEIVLRKDNFDLFAYKNIVPAR